jgi:hypothetical protein
VNEVSAGGDSKDLGVELLPLSGFRLLQTGLPVDRGRAVVLVLPRLVVAVDVRGRELRRLERAERIANHLGVVLRLRPMRITTATSKRIGATSSQRLKVLLSTRSSGAWRSASNAARWVARHGVRSHAVPVALVGECSIPVV